ncbi:unnamed protein product [Blepharisma stoltei]|uniref:PH domain-containing protein n=1 Tax=Blepharisma stoltei TaxID=1481888 RepID=A0AAU9KBP1_9CILI|nr:unnamed protein product [Blepharisma stoltei]
MHIQILHFQPNPINLSEKIMTEDRSQKKTQLDKFLSSISDNYSRYETDATLDNSQILTNDNTLTEKSGWLLKKSNNILRGYQQRYFVLKDKRLVYYRKESDPQPAGIINFNLITVDVQVYDPEMPRKVYIKPLGSKRCFVLKSYDCKEIIEWARALYRHITYSDGKKLDITTVSMQREFWRFDRVSEEQFRYQACTGDLILFKGKSVAAKLQRSVLRGRYDHVALLLCYSSGDIAILEATEDNGVSIVHWDDFLRYGWYKLYKRIAFRKLTMDRSEETLLKLENFIEHTKGKKYKISYKKVFGIDQHRQPGDEDNYFCSELIASAYKALGILNQNIASSRYWPGDFESKNSIPLTDAELGEEIMIDFEL